MRPLACWGCGFESHRVAWIFVFRDCCVLSDTGLCDGLITPPEESYRVWCMWYTLTLSYDGAVANYWYTVVISWRFETQGTIQRVYKSFKLAPGRRFRPPPSVCRYGITQRTVSCTEQDSNPLSQCLNVSDSTCTGMWLSSRELHVALI